MNNRRLWFWNAVALLMVMWGVGLAAIAGGEKWMTLAGTLLAAIGFMTGMAVWGISITRAQFRIQAELRKTKRQVGMTAGSIGKAAPLIRRIDSNLSKSKDVIFRQLDSQTRPFELVSMPPIQKVVVQKIEAPRGHNDVHGELRGHSLKRNEISRSIELSQEACTVSDSSEHAAVSLSTSGQHWKFKTLGQSSLTFTLTVLGKNQEVDPKAAIVVARAIDETGATLEYQTLNSISAKFGYYQYLSNEPGDHLIHINLPVEARSVEIDVFPWSTEVYVANRASARVISRNPEWLNMRSMKDVRIAAILDEFSYNSFRPECELFELTPSNWRRIMQEKEPDLFLCESAWSGSDSQSRPWKGRIYASENLPADNRAVLLEILDYCHKQAIPTVFWNKEDPSHYYDKRHNFVETAILFDHIFTTDIASVKKYELEFGHPSVHCLPFAAQPRLFNPISNGRLRTDDVIFAGAWYANHKDRCETMRTMFDSVVASGLQLKIYDRFYNTDDTLHQFPPEYRSFLNPPVAHSEMGQVYKESNIGMTINTEVRSSTMFARRVFELMASNTYVISNGSNGVKNFFGNNVIYLDDEPDALKYLDAQTIAQFREHNLRAVLAEHTYRDRLATILKIANVTYLEDDQKLNRAVIINEATDIPRVLSKFNQCYNRSDVTRTILLAHSVSEIDAAIAVQQYNGYDGISIAHLPMIAGDAGAAASIISPKYGLVIATPESSWPTSEELSLMRLHEQYVDSPIEISDSSYTFQERQIVDNTYFVAPESAIRFLENLGTGRQYYVYEV